MVRSRVSCLRALKFVGLFQVCGGASFTHTSPVVKRAFSPTSPTSFSDQRRPWLKVFCRLAFWCGWPQKPRPPDWLFTVVMCRFECPAERRCNAPDLFLTSITVPEWREGTIITESQVEKNKEMCWIRADRHARQKLLFWWSNKWCVTNMVDLGEWCFPHRHSALFCLGSFCFPLQFLMSWGIYPSLWLCFPPHPLFPNPPPPCCIDVSLSVPLFLALALSLSLSFHHSFTRFRSFVCALHFFSLQSGSNE